MDEYAYEELRLQCEGVNCCLSELVKSSCLSSFHPVHVFSRNKIAKKMKRISERSEEIAPERTHFHLTEIVPKRRNEVVDRRQTTSFINEPNEPPKSVEEKKIKIKL